MEDSLCPRKNKPQNTYKPLDIFNEFLEEHCNIGKGMRVHVTALHERYVEFCKENEYEAEPLEWLKILKLGRKNVIIGWVDLEPPVMSGITLKPPNDL